MHVAVVTFDGFNELDSLIAAHIINRVDLPGWRAEITSPTDIITSMNGVVMRAQQPLEFASRADAVIIGSGRKTREIVRDTALLSQLKLDPRRQLIASQCSGALVLMALGTCTRSADLYRSQNAGVGGVGGSSRSRSTVSCGGECGHGWRLSCLALPRYVADLVRRRTRRGAGGAVVCAAARRGRRLHAARHRARRTVCRAARRGAAMTTSRTEAVLDVPYINANASAAVLLSVDNEVHR
jgi:hypothetical protein